TVDLFFRGVAELDAAGTELFVGRHAVVGLEGAAAEDAFFDQRTELFGRLLVEDHPRLRLHERDLQLGLAGHAHPDPPAVAHPGVGAELQAELLGVEVDGAVVVQDIDGRVRESLEHRRSPFAGDLTAGGAQGACRRLRNTWRRSRTAPGGSGGAVPAPRSS